MKRILICALALMLAFAGCAFAEGAKLTVQGAGMVEVDADTATISIGVTAFATEVSAAQAVVNENIAAIIEALEALGIDKDHMSTSSINIYPNYDYSGPVEEINGYTANNTLQVITSDTQNVGKYIDVAFTAGANTLDYVTFSAADTTEAGKQALAMAVQNAREKAQVLADAAGMRLGDVVEMREAASYAYDMPVMYARAEDAGMGTQVIGSKQSVTATVEMVFELLDAE